MSRIRDIMHARVRSLHVDTGRIEMLPPAVAYDDKRIVVIGNRQRKMVVRDRKTQTVKMVEVIDYNPKIHEHPIDYLGVRR